MTADEEDESDFLQFARETINVLAIHAEQLSDDIQLLDQDSVYPEPTE